MSSPSHTKGLRAVATLEALKGVIVLAAGFGLLAFLGRDGEELATRMIARLHLNPAQHYPQIFIEAMAGVNDTRLWFLAALAWLYATIRLVEAYGLWFQRRWAEWLAALSGGVYVPIEIYELFHRVTWLRVSALVVNLAVVGYMAWLLLESRRERRAATQS